MTNPYIDWVEAGASAPDGLSQALDGLYQAGPPPAAAQAALRALQSALQPIHYDRLEDSPLGPLWLAVGPQGLLAVEYGGTEADLLAYLHKIRPGQAAQRSATALADIKDKLSAYLAQDSTQLSLDVDLSALTDFQQRVLEEARRVPRGQVTTYSQIAKRLGMPKAVRAVGQALRRNPIPIVVPCHRVVASDGSLGGYGGEMSSQRKIKLLQLEGAWLA